MIYVITFLLATLLGCVASKATGRAKAALCITSIIPLCLLAGLRANDIGTDVLLYAWPIYFECDVRSLLGVINYFSNSSELLFLIYSWVATKLFGTFEAYLFCLQMAVALPVAWFLYKEHPSNIGSGIFVYSFIFFGFTLNIMRQSITAAVLLFAFLAARDRKALKFLILVLIATGFHAAGLFGLSLWPIARVFSPNSDPSPTKKRRTVELQILCALLALIVLILTMVFGETALLLISSLKDSYTFQVRHMGEGDASYTVLIFMALAIALYFFLSRRSQKAGRNRYAEALPYLATICLAALLSQLSIISPELIRIGSMLLIFYAPLFSEMLSRCQDREEKLIVLCVLGFMSVSYFFRVYVQGGTGEIYPYASSTATWLNSLGGF